MKNSMHSTLKVYYTLEISKEYSGGSAWSENTILNSTTALHSCLSDQSF